MEAALALPTTADLLRAGAARLSDAGIETARLDAEVLLAHALGRDRAALYAHLRDAVDADVEGRFARALDRRRRREPVAYITGGQEFWSLRFAVDPAVLIPRPETERIVEIVERLSAATGLRTICDVGTGSGCIAVALAHTLPAARVTALDLSPAALDIAGRNAAAHGVANRIELVASDLFAALEPARRFDIIVSNPPYLAPDDPVSPELQFEPPSALWAGPDGLAVIRRLLAEAAPHLAPDGWLVMEIGAGQAETVADLARAAGWRQVSIDADLAGLPRVLVAQRG